VTFEKEALRLLVMDEVARAVDHFDVAVTGRGPEANFMFGGEPGPNAGSA
jgi:hypothetical protein